jgi:cytochrome c556
MYHYINVEIAMRDCETAVEAVRQLNKLMPEHPDETSTYMESWAVSAVWSAAEDFDRSTREREHEIERLVTEAEWGGR